MRLKRLHLEYSRYGETIMTVRSVFIILTIIGTTFLAGVNGRDAKITEKGQSVPNTHIQEFLKPDSALITLDRLLDDLQMPVLENCREPVIDLYASARLLQHEAAVCGRSGQIHMMQLKIFEGNVLIEQIRTLMADSR